MRRTSKIYLTSTTISPPIGKSMPAQAVN